MSRRTSLLGTFVLSALTMALYRFPFWIVEEFGDISLEQAWFHLTLDGGQTLATVPAALLRATARELLLKPLACIQGCITLLIYQIVRIQIM